MHMVVMLVMDVRVLVLQRRMHVLVFVPLRQMQVDARRHQHRCNYEFPRDRLG